jgi:hypothetical protein
MVFRYVATTLLLSTCAFAFAGDGSAVVGRIGNLVVDVPDGFNGPQRSSPNKQTVLDVYVAAPEQAATLIQLTWMSVPAARIDLNEIDRLGAASTFLDGFMEQFSNNVANWARTAVEPIQLGGSPAVREGLHNPRANQLLRALPG